MDDFSSDPELLARTVSQFRIVNRLLSRSRSLLKKHLIDEAVSAGLKQCSVLDLGGGDGDLGRWLARELSKRGIRPEITSLDHDPRVHDLARRADDGTAVRLLLGSAPDAISGERFDYVIGTLFLHHLEDDAIQRLLSQLRTVVIRRALFNDLRRSRLSLFGYTLFAALFLRKSFALFDGRASIRRGFRRRELAEWAQRAGWKRIEVKSRVPGHLVLLLEQ